MLMIYACCRRKEPEAEFGSAQGLSFLSSPLLAAWQQRSCFPTIILLSSLENVRWNENLLIYSAPLKTGQHLATVYTHA